ncbi:MAG: amidohydrolase family protein [Spirochaetota bacterium]
MKSILYVEYFITKNKKECNPMAGNNAADYEFIVDSHTHWGYSLSMGTNVSTNELLTQQKEAGITHIVIMPFPSTAIDDNEINIDILNEANKISQFIPYHYIREDYDRADFDPIPSAYYGGKWHWMRGIQDSSSSYKVLDDSALLLLIEKLKKTGKPVIFEEELLFTERFAEMADGLKLIIPHLGLLGGDPYDFLNSFKNNKNIFFDTALGDRSGILKFVETIGAGRVLFGSDVPFGSIKSELSKILSMPIQKDEKELLLCKNFLKLTDYKLITF